jgi:PAS domain S-box-containing protein
VSVFEEDDLRRENAELRTRVERLERAASIVEASTEAIVSTAPDGTLLSWNAAAQRLYGFTAGEAIGRNCVELVPFDRLVEHARAVARALAGARAVFESRRRCKDGREIAVELRYTRLIDPAGTLLGIAIVAHAIDA